MILINYEKVQDFASRLKNMKISVSDFADGVCFPRKDANEKDVLNFFFFIVAIDHRTSRNDSFIGEVDGVVYRGSDLLYRLAMNKFIENPSFFEPSRIAKLTLREAKEIFSVKKPVEKVVEGIELRVFLLRDAATKLMKLYDGGLDSLLRSTDNYLYKDPDGGFIEKLRIFRAYEDPVEKKPLLLAKFLERRGILRIRDPENKHVPVDNHLVRIAIRTGLVKIIDKNLYETFRWKREASWEEDVIIRLVIRKSYDLVSKEASIDPFILDDFLWSFGRTVCLPRNPRCELSNKYDPVKCPLAEICEAYRENEKKTLREHLYFSTWYY
mgnify:CR=1 FL=1